MAVLLIIPVVTIGLGVYVRRWTLAGSEAEAGGEPWLVDACARTLVVVLISLLGLLVLGVLYGNVLGAVRAGPGTF
jgi:ABC-type Fe3+ transport system permease subunit